MSFNLTETKGIINNTFYKVAREVDGFDKKLEKFKDELFAFCEQLGYKTKSYVYSDGKHNCHFVKISDYNVILFIFDANIKNNMSYLYLDETVRSSLKHQIKDDVFIHLKRKNDTLFDLNLDSKLIEYKKLATDWAKLLKEIRIDKKKAEIEQDFVNDGVSVEVVQVEKDFSNTPLPIYKRFAKKLLNVFKITWMDFEDENWWI